MYIPNIAMGNGPFIDIHRWFTWVYLLKMVDLSMAMLVITRWYICLLQKIYTVPPILMIKKILDIMFSMKVATMWINAQFQTNPPPYFSLKYISHYRIGDSLISHHIWINQIIHRPTSCFFPPKFNYPIHSTRIL